MLLTDLVKIGLEQLAPYPTVKVQSGLVVDAEQVTTEAGLKVWSLRTEDGKAVQAHAVIFATGLKDELSTLPASAWPLWGNYIISCPYCHGTEFSDARTAIIAPAASPCFPLYLGMLLMKVQGWTHPRNITLITNGEAMPEPMLAMAGAAGMTIKHGKVADFLTEGGPADKLVGVTLEDSTRVDVDVCYYLPVRTQACPLLAKLGVKMHEGGMFWQRAVTDLFGCTNVERVYAVGDAGSGGGAEQLVAGASSAIHAAVHANGELLKAGIAPAARKDVPA